MSTELRLSDIVANPDFFLHELKLADGQALFIEVTRESFTKSSFMDGRIAFTRERRHALALQSLIDAYYARPVPDRPVDFIFHISFCCSTLLARALQVDDRILSIREPYALIDLAHYKRSWREQPPPTAEQWRALLQMSLNLLAKTYRAGERALIKPSNMANALIEDLLELRARVRAILMYCDLPEFLIANLKKEETTKRKMWWLAEMFAGETDLLQRVPVQIGTLSHPQVVALLWHMQMYRFERLLSGPHAGRLASLDAATLLARPRDTLAAASEFLNIGLDADDVAAIAEGPTFKTHAKNPYARYSGADRERENAAVAAAHVAEIEQALAWSRETFAPLGISQPLPGPLVG